MFIIQTEYKDWVGNKEIKVAQYVKLSNNSNSYEMTKNISQARRHSNRTEALFVATSMKLPTFNIVEVK